MKNSNSLYITLFIATTVLMFIPLFFINKLANFQSWGLLGIFLINLVGSATIFIPTPAILSVGVGAKLYDPITVALIAAIGSSIGDSLGLLLGHVSKEVLPIKKHPLLSYLSKYFLKKYGSIGMFLFALIPNPIFDGIGIVAGLAGFSLMRFLLITFAGRFLRNSLIALAIISL